MVAFALTGIAATAAAEQYFLYTPATTEVSRIPASPADGILTRTVTVRPGDTLRKLSRSYSGRGSFFPQILLFNNIRNPDLILAGEQLRVPVTRQEAPASQPAVKKEMSKVKNAPAPQSGGVVKQSPRRTVVNSAAEQKLFKRGAALYNKGAYRRALDIFNVFLKNYPDSRRAADAALYKADCYLKLAGRQAR
jgi:TolA-binding protein